jgi:methyltransferase (TIGR00027 family)
MKQAVSRTAMVVALWRARESQRSAASRLFEDDLAQGFLDRRFRVALRVSRVPLVGSLVPWSLIDGHWTGSRGTVAVRTRYIDDALTAALRRGVEQIVILGAGFDGRAYRIPGIDRARVFEVDHPVTQAEKKKAVTRRLGALPPHVEFVPIDFSTQTLDGTMPAAGFRATARTFFICEGVTHYLSDPDVDTLFRYVARSVAAGSEMVFTYIHRTILDGSATFDGADKTLTTVRRSGEPYTFGFDPARLPEYLAARDFVLIEDVGADEYRARYLAPLGRGHEPLSEFQRAALVRVASSEAKGPFEAPQPRSKFEGRPGCAGTSPSAGV